jgi:hypothetical protein
MSEEPMDNGARDDLDRDLVETMRELRSLAQVRVPASSRARVDREVESAIARLVLQREEQTMNQAAIPAPAATRPWPGTWAAPHQKPRRSPLLTSLATAALLVVTLGLSYAGFGAVRLRPLESTPLPAAFVQVGTPVGTSETRFEVAFPAPLLPAGPVYAWSTMYEVEPGVSATYPGFEIESPVAALVWVQSGTMAIDGEHIAVHRSSAGAPVASPAPSELLLGAGDAVGLELGPDHSYELRSVGPEPLVFAEFWMVGGPRPRYGWPSEYEILDYHNVGYNAPTLTSPATVTMRLTLAVLPPDETLAPDEGAWQLALTDRRSGSSISREVPSGALKNVNRAPITVAAMTAEFREEATTPTVASPTG